MYDRKITGNEGLAKLNINLDQGEYIITVINLNTSEMTANTITVIPRIIENSNITNTSETQPNTQLRSLGMTEILLVQVKL